MAQALRRAAMELGFGGRSPRAEALQSDAPRVSVVITVLDEAENVEAVTAETVAALEPLGAFEVVYVDDGSSDATPQVLARLSAADPRVRVVTHPRRCGKSMAVRTGVLAARAEWIATLDGDGQNDPADIPAMLRQAWAAKGPAPLVCGVRVNRKDPPSRLLATRFANGLRRRVLNDDCPDTGCGLKVFRRDDFLLLPIFEGQHRYMAALFATYGHPLLNTPVNHRARLKGVSKYTNWGRALVGMVDILGVIWLTRRTRAPSP